MKQKRIVAGVLACLLLAGMAGCGKKAFFQYRESATTV